MREADYFVQNLIISIIIITTSIVLFDIGLNNHHSVIAQQQQNKSMVLGGVHSPEFQFGKNHTNSKSVTETGVSHPVSMAGMDENHTIMTYKALLNDHMKVILKYNYLAEDLIEMTVYPKLIEEKKSQLSSETVKWPKEMHF